jgi:para-nitrobenzyl esterase
LKKIGIPTRHGTLTGAADSAGVSAFKGVPYVKQPIDERRWLPPEHPEESNREIECLEFGNTAIQGIDPVEEASLFPQGEDCLTLNIWTRGLWRNGPDHPESWPVMVFIHGGSYMSGGTTDPLYDGYRFAADNDVVFVTVNYRLNLLGFVSFEEIGGSAYRESGHLGLLDQIAALEWVRENIAHFGGDPGNVTIFGESCGGGSVSLLMTMERARGLFHKVIAQSGSVILRKSSDLSRRIGWDLMRMTGCTGMTDLLHLDADTIRRTIGAFEADYGMKSGIMYAPRLTARFCRGIPSWRSSGVRAEGSGS